jgi:hypothetical protein
MASLSPSPVMVIDARVRRGGDGLVAALAQNGDGLRADQAGAADDDDLHGLPSLATVYPPLLRFTLPCRGLKTPKREYK